MIKTLLFQTGSRQTYFPEKGLLQFVLLAVLFAGAFAIRLHHISEPPLDFAPTRQYRSALLSHSIYSGQGTSTLKVGLLEPPVMEYMASGVYWILGEENLTAARVMSVSFWMLGAVFLYLLARQAISADGAVVAFTFFLYLPYGVSASRSFQPDPLMIMLFIGSIWAIFMLRHTPSRKWWTAAILFSALAIFIKPVCLFPIWLCFLTTGIYQEGLKATLWRASTALYFFLSFLPSLIYYGNGLFIDGFLRWQAKGSFAPHLLLHEYYWRGWMINIIAVFGGATIVVALLGIPLIRSRLGKGLLIGLVIGYVVFGLVFSFHIFTHKYYQLPLIPIVALCLGVVAAIVLKRLAKTNAFWRWSLFAAMVFALVISSEATQKKLRINVPDSYAALRKEIGNRVEHSRNTIFLAYAYGNPLMYYGRLSGVNWPHECDFVYTQLRTVGAVHMPQGDALLKSMLEESPSDYFIVTDMPDFSKQPDLKEALQKYPLIFSNNQCFVYDLRAGKLNDE